MHLRYIFSAFLCSAALWVHAGNATTTFSYSQSDQALTQWGYQKSETYDVAVLVNNPALVGKRITSISAPLQSSGCTNLSVWLSSELKTSGKNNLADITSVEASLENGWITATLPEPYTLTDAGVYVGYTFTDPNPDYPIICVNNKLPGTLWIHSAKTQLKWKDYSEELQLCSTLKITIEGEFPEYAAGVAEITQIMVDPGKQALVPVLIRNNGATPLSSVEYTVKSALGEDSHTILLPANSADGFLSTTNVILPIETFSEVGENPFSLEITKVNGEPNTTPGSKEGIVHVISFTPTRRPLMEEYTGINCGYCTRGLAALERMWKLYPDRFVGVSYHRDDCIQFTNDFPAPSQSFALPTAYMSRSEEIDPYFGPKGSTGNFPIENYWKEIAAQQVIMDVDLAAGWMDDAQNIIRVKSNVTFARSADRHYRMAYILVADGLHDPSWIQANYYAGDNASLFIPEMAQFCNAERHISDVIYNDVAVAFTPMEGEPNSLPTNPKINVENSHTYTFDITDLKSLENVPLIQDKSKLRVVAAVVDETGYVYNCNIAPVGTSNIGSVCATSKVVSSTFYTLHGIEIKSPGKGLYIRVDKLSDGSCVSNKINL